MLGGSHFQLPSIKYAKNAGHYVITADYLPNNPGHKYADEYYNVSTIDEKAILKLAESLNIDGILSYASDPGATTAAYVSDKLGLPGNPYNSVKILQQKDLFRNFLKENGFNFPESTVHDEIKSAKKSAHQFLIKYGAIIIKPSDSSGSKGVTKLVSLRHFNHAYQNALQYSFNKKIIIEQFIKKKTYEMDGDGFVWNGKLVFRCFGNQHNNLNCNPHVPVGISFPYIQNEALQQRAHNDIEKVLSLLEMNVGGLNLEYLTDVNDQIFILEIAPRNGGNLIPEVIKYSTNVDLIEYSVEGALGRDCSDLQMVQPKHYFSSYILHSEKDGIVKDIMVDNFISKNIIKKNIFVQKGDRVKKFNGSNETLGTFILQFSNQDEMLALLDNMTRYIKVIVD